MLNYNFEEIQEDVCKFIIFVHKKVLSEDIDLSCAPHTLRLLISFQFVRKFIER